MSQISTIQFSRVRPLCSLLVLLSKPDPHRDKIQHTFYSLHRSSQRNQGIFLRWSSVSSEKWTFSLSLQAFVFYLQWWLLSLFFLFNSHSFYCSAAHLLFLLFPAFYMSFCQSSYFIFSSPSPQFPIPHLPFFWNSLI